MELGKPANLEKNAKNQSTTADTPRYENGCKVIVVIYRNDRGTCISEGGKGERKTKCYAQCTNFHNLLHELLENLRSPFAPAHIDLAIHPFCAKAWCLRASFIGNKCSNHCSRWKNQPELWAEKIPAGTVFGFWRKQKKVPNFRRNYIYKHKDILFIFKWK